MKDLETKTYQFSIKGIGLAKSLEKEKAEFESKDLMRFTGRVSVKFIDAMNAKENKAFADNLRACFSSTEQSLGLLGKLKGISNEDLEQQKNVLVKEGQDIIEKLDSIIKKLIY